MPDLKDALEKIDTGRWVSIAYVGYDAKRRTAGDIVRINRCRLATGGNTPAPAGSTRPAASLFATGGAGSKPANHYEHFTRNMKLRNGQLRKLHPRLLIAINGEKLI